MKIEWRCTEPIRVFDKIEYTIYNDVNENTIKCKSDGKMKDVKIAIETTLSRMNFTKKKAYNNGLRK